MRKKSFVFLLAVGIFAITAICVYASSTSRFNQTINGGTLSVDIVNGSYATVASPNVYLTALSTSFTCQTSTGTFGSSTEMIYVSNMGAANNGWTLAVGATNGTSSLWVGSSTAANFDFNDPGSSGCASSSDGDAFAGQMSVDASGGTLTAINGTTGSITKGTLAAYTSSSNAITLLNAATSSDDVADWTLTNVAISQKIPALSTADSYYLNMTLTIAAN